MMLNSPARRATRETTWPAQFARGSAAGRSRRGAGVFYPKGTRQADELNYASRKLTAIEINGTYYSSQKPETFAKWAADTPDGFVFSVKASRFCTNRRVLAEAGESIERFFAQGVGELGDRLGPILWQFMADQDSSRARISPPSWICCRRTLDGRALRHCVEVRHASFQDAAFVDLCREHGVAICLADHPTYPMIEDMTADFVYARLMQGRRRHRDLLWRGGSGCVGGALQSAGGDGSATCSPTSSVRARCEPPPARWR